MSAITTQRGIKAESPDHSLTSNTPRMGYTPRTPVKQPTTLEAQIGNRGRRPSAHRAVLVPVSEPGLSDGSSDDGHQVIKREPDGYEFGENSVSEASRAAHTPPPSTSRIKQATVLHRQQPSAAGPSGRQTLGLATPMTPSSKRSRKADNALPEDPPSSSKRIRSANITPDSAVFSPGDDSPLTRRFRDQRPEPTTPTRFRQVRFIPSGLSPRLPSASPPPERVDYDVVIPAVQGRQAEVASNDGDDGDESVSVKVEDGDGHNDNADDFPSPWVDSVSDNLEEVKAEEDEEGAGSQQGGRVELTDQEKLQALACIEGHVSQQASRHVPFNLQSYWDDHIGTGSTPDLPKDGPPCKKCRRVPTKLCWVGPNNQNGNAGRPYYKCAAEGCNDWLTWADMRGVNGNELCDCGFTTRLCVTTERASSGPGLVFYKCYQGTCNIFGWAELGPDNHTD